MRYKKENLPEVIATSTNWKLLSVLQYGSTEISIYKVTDDEEHVYIVHKFNNFDPFEEDERVLYEIIDLNPYDY